MSDEHEYELLNPEINSMSIRANEGWRLGNKLIKTSTVVIFIHDLAIFLYRHKLIWHGRVVFE